jgi:hypothetical protein
MTPELLREIIEDVPRLDIQAIEQQQRKKSQLRKSIDEV